MFVFQKDRKWMISAGIASSTSFPTQTSSFVFGLGSGSSRLGVLSGTRPMGTTEEKSRGWDLYYGVVLLCCYIGGGAQLAIA